MRPNTPHNPAVKSVKELSNVGTLEIIAPTSYQWINPLNQCFRIKRNSPFRSVALRAYIAEILLESLDYEEDFVVSEAWRQEIQKRCEEIDTNPSLLIDGEQFMAELKQRYSALEPKNLS